MKTLDKIRESISKFEAKFGVGLPIVVTVGFTDWHDCLKEFDKCTNFADAKNMAIDSNVFIYMACKVIWSHAFKKGEVFVGIEYIK